MGALPSLAGAFQLTVIASLVMFVITGGSHGPGTSKERDKVMAITPLFKTWDISKIKPIFNSYIIFVGQRQFIDDEKLS